MTAAQAALLRAELDAIGYAALALLVVLVLFAVVGSALLRNTGTPTATTKDRQRQRDQAGIDQQIASLRATADKAVATRPRVRAGSIQRGADPYTAKTPYYKPKQPIASVQRMPNATESEARKTRA